MGADHTDLLVDGEECLDRAVAQRVVRQDGHHVGYPDAVVRTEGRIACRDPLAVNVGVSGVGDEVVLHVAILLWHHVEVRLQRHDGALLQASRSGLMHQHIPHSIPLGLEPKAGGQR